MDGKEVAEKGQMCRRGNNVVGCDFFRVTEVRSKI